MAKKQSDAPSAEVYTVKVPVVSINVYKSTRKNMLTKEVPVYKGLNNALWTPVHAIKLESIRKGELIQIFGQQEVTVEIENELNEPPPGWRTHGASCVIRFVANHDYDDQPGQKGAVFVSESGGGPNVRKEVQHHEVLTRISIWCPQNGYEKPQTRYVTMMIRCASSKATDKDRVLLDEAPSSLEIIRMVGCMPM
jgi:hypothetical protein